MIASILRLGPKDLKALRVTDDYSMHRVVYSLFEDRRSEVEKNASVPSGFLYADKGGDSNGRLILLLSDREPRQPEHGVLESKVIDDKFMAFDRYRFEVVINPTKRDSKSRKLIALRDRDEIAQWFIEKAPASWGFTVHSASLQVQTLHVKQFVKQTHSVTHGGAELIGELEVVDRSLFIKSFQQGIGRGRAFGFGLLQIAPLKASITN
ncbi:type I-E CRISPR-associated protein Cas6/Cse3/CasE [Chlorobium sp. BLA1]|uniref:type I-E CRISPR-associated protein Cas6/Cse3/CasE n=1 Tax=Candidatus Chlorobium masyuteum TaxID=2716876 RepID=UPI001421132F|nr:type I-E CRISPR-associated protein Cas6/Cse3/CasE [Candidatus Chlorobium masyuteum]NHQ60666.1 type I-E CRISPR-associated protein Cas6/Cse3/CasE [Candidatus Chlorobium masyuteum]